MTRRWLFMLCAGCAKVPPADPVIERPSIAPVEASLALLQSYMVGRFDSSAQSKTDAAYFDVSLAVCAVQWDGAERSLYVEQAMSAKPAEPYRQRIYVLSRDGDTFRSEMYAPTDAASLVGLCDDPASFVSSTEATRLEGCAVDLVWDGHAFRGATDGRSCTNAWGAATYATSEVVIDVAGLTSWDRGFDDTGEQVWGAVAGPYRFLRREASD